MAFLTLHPKWWLHLQPLPAHSDSRRGRALIPPLHGTTVTEFRRHVWKSAVFNIRVNTSQVNNRDLWRGSLRYLNLEKPGLGTTGDWLESQSVLKGHFSGRLLWVLLNLRLWLEQRVAVWKKLHRRRKSSRASVWTPSFRKEMVWVGGIYNTLIFI